MGKFTIPKVGFVSIKSAIYREGAQIAIKVNNNTVHFGHLSRGKWITDTSNYIMMLNPGTYEIKLYMDADNEGSSNVTNQKYEIDAIYPNFDF